MAIEKITAEQQYRDLKLKYPGCILLFRMGDFYELFDEDAIIISKAVGLTLTSRDRGETKRPMAGLPHHAISQYLGKIVKLGFKVAIAEQMENPKEAVGVLKRDVVKVITAANLVDEKNLLPEERSYMLAISEWNNKPHKGFVTYALSYIDVSTGEFYIKEFVNPIDHDISKYSTKFINFVINLSPKEIIATKSLYEIIKNRFTCSVHFVDEIDFNYERSYRELCEFFKVKSLKGFGCEEKIFGITSAGVVLNYLQSIEKSNLSHISKLIYENDGIYMDLDYSTVRNLELIETINIRSNAENISLLKVIDRTITPVGKRTVRSWLIKPLINIEIIKTRQSLVKIFNRCISNNNLEILINETLSGIYDIERYAGRIGMQNINPKDLIGLKQSIISSVRLMDVLKQVEGFDESSLSKETYENLAQVSPIIGIIEKAILEEPSVEINSGDIFKNEYNSEIENLRNLRSNGNDWLMKYQADEIEKTKISSLKVKFNNVFGYFIEVSNSNKSNVPDNYIRKQTLVNAERYITDELKGMEDKILNSSDQLIELEKNLFIKFRQDLLKYIVPIQRLSKCIGAIDTLFGFAKVAFENHYVIPNFIENNNKPLLKAKNLRHPVIDTILKDKYVANDVNLGDDNFVILTGPNMSGKSTYIRSVAILVILAQIGSFVPATECELSLVDKIFTRIGAADNLSTGESTFMVEMNETANILNNATQNSLVILDEVGRGTSTYDGLAIAYAVVKYLNREIACLSMFATHYHELTKLEETNSGIANYCVSVYESNSEILFLHKIERGSAKKSFGIHVAKLAGIPMKVISDSEKMLEQLEAHKNELKRTKTNQKNDADVENLYENMLLN